MKNNYLFKNLTIKIQKDKNMKKEKKRIYSIVRRKYQKQKYNL